MGTAPIRTKASVFIWLVLLSISRNIDKGSTLIHNQINETKTMHELTKAIFFLAISAPILYGVNSLTNSVSSYPDSAVFAVDTVTISTQAYDKGTDPLY